VFEEDEKKDDVEDELEETQEEVVGKGNEGELFVIRRVLSNEKGAKDKFHCRCKVQGGFVL